jgi:hypothetical protein
MKGRGSEIQGSENVLFSIAFAPLFQNITAEIHESSKPETYSSCSPNVVVTKGRLLTGADILLFILQALTHVDILVQFRGCREWIYSMHDREILGSTASTSGCTAI